MEIIASDYAGVRYAFSTFVQIIRLHSYALHQIGVALPGHASVPVADANNSVRAVNGVNHATDKTGGDPLTNSNPVFPDINLGKQFSVMKQ